MMTKNNDPKPTAGRMKDKGVTAISDYLKPNMPLPQYLPYARFLLDTDLCHTAKMLYTLLLDRATLSQKNNWVDEQGRIYVIYPLSNLAKDLGCCVSSVTRAFTELEKCRSCRASAQRIFQAQPYFAQSSSYCAELRSHSMHQRTS